MLLARLFIVVFLVSACLAPSCLASEDIRQADALSGWTGMKDAFDRLVIEPSPATTRGFYFSIPNGALVDTSRPAVLNHIFEYDRYRILAIEMLNGDLHAARAAMRMLKMVGLSSGWMRRVGESLGALIRVNPSAFLRACHEEREDPHFKENGFPVGFIPSIMRRRELASYELGMRLKALKSVDDPGLRPIRDECLERLKKEIDGYGREISIGAEIEEMHFDDPIERINNTFMDMLRMPCPENMKRVLALFSEDEKFNADHIRTLIFPSLEPGGRLADDPFYLIAHEARNGNEYAIDVLFRGCIYVIGLPSMEFCRLVSNFILIKPILFIKKLAKYRNNLASLTYLDYLDCVCNYLSFNDYPEGTDGEIILRRRIEALEGLDLPEHKELIDHCISLIKKRLK